MDHYSAFKDSLQRVKSTRAKRRHEKLPKMTPEQKQDLLERFHHDFRQEGFRAIPIGKNRGEKAPHEPVDLSESPSRLKGISLDLTNPHFKVDVLVVGGGGGGSSAALAAHDAGADVMLATKLRHGDSNTIMAEGGIGAATRPEDSPAIHYVDTLRGGR